MRTLRLLILAALLAPAGGCKWFDELKTGTQGKRPTDKIPEIAPERLVGFLNDRASRLRSIEYDTSMRVSGKTMLVPATLDGSLAAAQPRNFRLSGAPRLAKGRVDMGSNAQEFWVYVDAPGEDPIYVYASHADFESGKAKMPGGIPFEPDWVMQALGMTMFPPGNAYTAAINDRERTYTLTWTASVPGAAAVRKEIVFDADGATGSKPQVKKHVIRDAKSNKPLATAEIKRVETIRAGKVTGSDLPAVIQYPTHVVLKWEDPRFEMDMTLEKAQVNQAPSEDPVQRALFARPEIRGAKPIDLARYEFPPLK